MLQSFILFFLLVFQGVAGVAEEEDPPQNDALQLMRNMMKNILVDNQKFRDDPLHDEAYFQKQAEEQKPRATIVACSDSRVHTSNFDLHPLRDVFFVRNIGNQLETCLGSVDYGVLHLNTPVLLILGHSQCGAVKAVTEGTNDLEESIRKELAPMRLVYRNPHPTDYQLAENVAKNVYNQVNKAHTRYHDRIEQKALWVIGAVYDFTPQGRGGIQILQVNDQTDAAYISRFLEDVQEHGDYYNDPGRALSP